MKQPLTPHRPVMAALFAAFAFSTAPVFAQDVTTAPPPPPISAPPPTITAPPAPVTVAPAPAPVVRAPVAAPAPQARTAPRAARATPARTAVRAPAPARTAAPAPVPAAAAPAPAIPAETAPAPAAVAPPAPVPVEPAPAPAEPAATTTSLLPWILGAAALLILAFGLFALRRRRPADAVYEETEEQAAATAPAAPYEEPVLPIEPALAMAPFAPEPTFVRVPVEESAADAPEPISAASIEEVEIVDSDAADVEALAADSAPVAGRPWLEFLLRPLRAGTSRDNAIVEFELTVGNTGSVPARDVRISTWMVAAGEGSDMERALIEVPADATVSEVDIDAGDGARVDAKIAMAKEGFEDGVLPVVVADARYTLPDGSEGRTHASFAIGVPEEDGSALQPFPTDRSSGLRENVEARLYGEPERV